MRFLYFKYTIFYEFDNQEIKLEGKMKVKNIIETYSLEREPYGHNATEHGELLDNLINKFIVDKKVIDIRYDGVSPRSVLVMYEEVEE